MPDPKYRDVISDLDRDDPVAAVLDLIPNLVEDAHLQAVVDECNLRLFLERD